jgi:hypothetical protein
MKNEAMEAQIPKLTEMGKEMNAFQGKEEHMSLHHGSRVSIDKENKRKSKKQALKHKERTFYLRKKKQILFDLREEGQGEATSRRGRWSFEVAILKRT